MIFSLFPNDTHHQGGHFSNVEAIIHDIVLKSPRAVLLLNINFTKSLRPNLTQAWKSALCESSYSYFTIKMIFSNDTHHQGHLFNPFLEGSLRSMHSNTISFPGGRGSFRSKTRMVPEPYVDFNVEASREPLPLPIPFSVHTIHACTNHYKFSALMSLRSRDNVQAKCTECGYASRHNKVVASASHSLLSERGYWFNWTQRTPSGSSRAPPPSTVAWKEAVVGIPTIPQAPIRLQYLITPTQLYHVWILHTLDWLRGVANTHFNKWYSSLLTDIHDTIA